jgi:Ion channel
LERVLILLKKYWNERKSFNFLLTVLVIYIFLIIPLLKQKLTEEVLFFIFYFLLLSTSVPFLMQNKRMTVLVLLIITPFIFLISEYFFSSVWVKILADIFIVFYCVSLGAIIMLRTFAKGHVTVHRVFGAIIVYLLMSFVFAMLYHTTYLLGGQQAFNGLKTHGRVEFMYFSLSTLTTAAYGDIVPVNTMARSLANLESADGVLYVSILIARLVSMGYSTTKTNMDAGQK